jgi:DNA repair protein RecO (recombination protein O)
VPTVRDQALCLRTWDFSETSQTVVLFGREQGLVRALAKGSRRDRAPFSGGLEIVTRGEMVAILKSSGALATLTAWDLQETFPAARRSLRRFHASVYLADALAHSLHDVDPHPALFDAAVRALRRLAADPATDAAPWPEPALPEALARFLLVLLDQTGHRPELASDVLRDLPLEPDAPTYAFDPRLGGFTADDGADASRWRVRAETARALATLQASDDAGATPVLAPETAARAAALLHRTLTWTLGRDLPSSGDLFG